MELKISEKINNNNQTKPVDLCLQFVSFFYFILFTEKKTYTREKPNKNNISVFVSVSCVFCVCYTNHIHPAWVLYKSNIVCFWLLPFLPLFVCSIHILNLRSTLEGVGWAFTFRLNGFCAEKYPYLFFAVSLGNKNKN